MVEMIQYIFDILDCKNLEFQQWPFIFIHGYPNVIHYVN